MFNVKEIDSIFNIFRVLDISPENDFFHYLIGTAYQMIESKNQALYHYDKAVKINQDWLKNGYVKMLYMEL